jgi:rhamnose transport system permease protein
MKRAFPSAGRSTRLPALLRVRELRTVILLAIVVVGTYLIQPRYLNPNSLRSILVWIPLVVIIGMGEMMVIIIRGIDVSVGSIVGLAGLSVGMLFRGVPGFPIAAAVCVSVLIGLALGSLNGAIIAKAGVPGVIVTLGGLSAYRGVTFLLTRGSQIDGNFIPKQLIRWSQLGPFGIRELPWIVVIALCIAALTWIVLRYTKLGRDLYALGSNPEAARLRGVAVGRVTFFAYAFTGALSGFAGLLYSSRFGFLNPGQTGVGMEMTVIAAVVIGGVSPFGGSGSVIGVLLGCLLLGAVNVALAVLGIAGAWQLAVYGAVILLAVASDAVFQIGLHRADRSE